MKASEILLRFARVKLHYPLVLPAKVSPDYLSSCQRRKKRRERIMRKRGPSTEVVRPVSEQFQ